MEESQELIQKFNNNIVALAKEADMETLLNLLNFVVVDANEQTRLSVLPAMERRLFDISTQLSNGTTLSSLVSFFGHAHYQSTNLWEFFT